MTRMLGAAALTEAEDRRMNKHLPNEVRTKLRAKIEKSKKRD